MSKKKTVTADELYEQATDLIEEARDRDALYDRLDALYDQEKAEEDETAAGESRVQRVTMPYASSMIDLVADLAAQMELSLTVPAAKESQQAKQDADSIERWLLAWFKSNQTRQHKNYTADLGFLGAQRGACVLRTLFVDSALEQVNGERQIKRMPVILQARDPRTVYWQDGLDGLDTVVESWERPLREIRILYPDVLPDLAGRDKVEWTEVWTKEIRCYFANGEPVRTRGKAVIPHGLGCNPYVVGMARTLPVASESVRFRPLLRAVENTVENVDMWFSILATAGWASQTSGWNVFSDNYGKGGKKIDRKPDAVNYFAQNDRVEPLQRAALPGDFFQLGTLLLNAMQMATFPFAIFGQASGQMAGYAISLLSQAGRRALMPIWSGIEGVYEAAFRNAALICKNKLSPLVMSDKIPLTVLATSDGKSGLIDRGKSYRRTLELDVSSIDDDFAVVASLSDPMPADEAQNMRMALEMSGGDDPLLSHETALTKFKIVSDPVSEAQRILVEKMFRQYAPIEGLKLAIERGVVPGKVTLPAGWSMGPDGRLVPDALAPKPEPVPQAPPQPKPQPMPDPAMMQQMAGMPPPQSLDETAGMPPTQQVQ